MVQSKKHLEEAIAREGKEFQKIYLWLEKAMPHSFFREVSEESILLIAHSLMGFHLQQCFSTIQMKHTAIILCEDSPDADLRILEKYAMYGIKNYQTYISKSAPPLPEVHTPLRVGVIYFTEAFDTPGELYLKESREALRALAMARNEKLTEQEFDKLIDGMNSRFLNSLSTERLVVAVDMFFRAQTRDNCQYEVYYNEDWKEKELPSMQIMLAWRNTPKHNFLYRMARTIHRHGLIMKRVNSCYINPYGKRNSLVMALSLHGSGGEAAWDVANITDFLRELATVKYFASFDPIDTLLVNKKIISGTMGIFLRGAVDFVQQILVHLDPHKYSVDNIMEALCRHPELTKLLCTAFEQKFSPLSNDYEAYKQTRKQLLSDLEQLDTGHVEYDKRRKMVLRQAVHLVHYTLKTNLYRHNYTAISFRLDPLYLEELPFDRKELFPKLPFAIIFIKGMHFFGFHIRFTDLARGGLRTLFLKKTEQMWAERNNVFTECYNLAYTQQKKNKDIPEGGAKALIFLKPYDRLDSETKILKTELINAQTPQKEVKTHLKKFTEEQKEEYLYQTQRSFIESLLSIVNCNEQGVLRAKDILDYWKKPEYLYLGPDENMHDEMINWIANFSKRYNYKPGTSFISGKPDKGINHKEYGITSLGVNIYMDTLLHYLKIDPKKTPFTIKMSGGPDGDVAGNQILNLYKHYPKTARLLTLIDVSGVIYDPKGLDLKTLKELFLQGKSINSYPPELLNDGGFLLDKHTQRRETPLLQETLCWKKIKGKLVEKWLPGSLANALLRHTVHKTPADIFIPAGGRPRTLNDSNVHTFIDEKGEPTAKGIIEGANLYLDNEARHFLEEKGVLIIKDSSANKAGVICSSFEIIAGLTNEEAVFTKHKKTFVKEVLKILEKSAHNEADLILKTHEETNAPLTEISDQISEKINRFTYEILDYLESTSIPKKLSQSLVETSLLSYCPPLLREKFSKEFLRNLPAHHKHAIIACHIAAPLVYSRGLKWHPSIVDILPLLIS